MSVRPVFKVVCDRCGRPHFAHASTPEEARQRADGDGWQVIEIGEWTADLCCICAPIHWRLKESDLHHHPLHPRNLTPAPPPPPAREE